MIPVFRVITLDKAISERSHVARSYACRDVAALSDAQQHSSGTLRVMYKLMHFTFRH